MRAYVQEVKQGANNYLGLAQAAHWFWERGYEVIRFQFEEIEQGKLDHDLLENPEQLVVRGGVEAIRQILLRAGRPLPPNLDLPDSLAKWIGRNIWQTTMDEVRDLVETDGFQLIHIKPLVHHKLFNGMVIRAFRDLIPTAGISGDCPVLAQECVEFVSEWRATILRDEVLNVAHYLGYPLVFPDVETMRSAIPAFVGRPIGFGMDWGITSTRQTLLVEVNDAYSLGNYGLRGKDFTALIEARWRELMGLPDNALS